MYPGSKPRTPTVSFLLVVIPESRELRAAIKQWGDVEEGVVTQIVRASKLHRASNQYCNNLALKLNVKLGGANNTTTPQSLQHILKLGTMVRDRFSRNPHV
jgi:eukaryotic translation initiation factor 2C